VEWQNQSAKPIFSAQFFYSEKFRVLLVRQRDALFPYQHYQAKARIISFTKKSGNQQACA